jgi:hypothetical protein
MSGLDVVASFVSQIYHSIRGQETIKLYVIFNALEVCAFHTAISSPLLTLCT